MSRRGKRDRIAEALVAHGLSMRRSLGWGALPDYARRVMTAMEDEHIAHGGAQYEALVRTDVDLPTAAVPRKATPLALRQLAALGFVRVIACGRPSISDYRSLSRYQLTYVHSRSSELLFPLIGRRLRAAI